MQIRLRELLILKSIVETIFVGGLAVLFCFTAFNPYFRGSVDEAHSRSVSGWAVDERAPGARVEVQLYINDRFIQSRLADTARPDVLEAGRAADERHGFRFDRLPPLEAGEHVARVYAVHASDGGARRTLQLIGRPVRFRVEAAGER